MQVDEKQKSVLLSEVGYEAAEEILAVTDLYDPREQWASYLINAIKAKELFLKNVNYIVRGQEALIVDEFTGRVMQVNNRLSILWIVTQSAGLQ
jgi:preprotein translocase subunit SecA